MTEPFQPFRTHRIGVGTACPHNLILLGKIVALRLSHPQSGRHSGRAARINAGQPAVTRTISPAANSFRPAFRHSVCLWLTLLLLATPARAEDSSFTNLLAKGDLAGQQGDIAKAMQQYAAAEALAATNCTELCQVTKCYSDLMHLTSSTDTQKTLAMMALAVAQRAEQVDPKNATAHLCVAVCYAKNFPYAGNAAKVNWSKAVKTECETAIALDPRQDVGYYLLGRWHANAASMGLATRGLVRLVYGGLPSASYAEAIKNFQQAIALAPNRVIHHLELGKVYEVTGNKKLAREEFEKCGALKPVDKDDAEAQKEAATHLAALGK